MFVGSHVSKVWLALSNENSFMLIQVNWLPRIHRAHMKTAVAATSPLRKQIYHHFIPLILLACSLHVVV